MSDGNVANTYLEYLYDKLPNVAKFIDELHKDKTGIYIEHVLGRLNELIPEIEYLNTMNGTNNNIVQAIIGLINFFKSYTVDLRTLNILYMFNNKTLNKIYMIDDPRLFFKMQTNEILPTYSDSLKPTVTFDKNDNLIIYDPRLELVNNLYINSNNDYEDKIDLLVNKFEIEDTMEMNYKDMLECFNHLQLNNDVVDLRENKYLSAKLVLKDQDEFNDKCTTGIKILKEDVIQHEYMDNMQLCVETKYKENININEAIKVIYED